MVPLEEKTEQAEGEKAGPQDIRTMNGNRSVLFICTHNSVRSFMAEYIGRSKYPDIVFRSAGIYPLKPDPAAVAVLKEDSIDPGDHRPSTIGSCSGECFDLIVFMCPHAMRMAYSLPKSNGIILHEVSVLAGGTGNLSGFRELRDSLKVFIDEIAETIRI